MAISKRRIRGPKLKGEIPCGYCFYRWAEVYDHIIPVSHGGTNRKSNLYPSCARCNGLLSDKVFDTIEAKREYVRLVLKARGILDGDKKPVNRPHGWHKPKAEKEKWFTPAEVEDIVAAKKQGHSTCAIAISYLCSTSMISKVVKTGISPNKRPRKGGATASTHTYQWPISKRSAKF